MRDPSNIRELVKLNTDYIGFIFYPKSKRYIGRYIPKEILSVIPAFLQKVGVFVDEPIESLIKTVRDNKLDIIQLHGDEFPDYCEKLNILDVPVIKAFNISPDFDYNVVSLYDDVCQYFLFDTASALRGGTGLKFDWGKLNEYAGNKPFFLSGGIRPEDAESIKGIKHTALYGIDVNSGFEIEPGIKDILKLRSFTDRLRGE